MFVNLQQEIYSALSNHAPLTPQIVGIYDHVPQSTNYPFIVIGDDDHINADTDGFNRNECLIAVDVWSRERSKKQCKEIMQEIYTCLHCTTSMNGGVDFITFSGSDIILDSDGLTWHGIVTFKVVILEE